MNSKYELIIYWSDEDHAFLVEVPELPGCIANDETQSEALLNAQIVIDQWIQIAKELGREIPKPKGKLMFA